MRHHATTPSPELSVLVRTYRTRAGLDQANLSRKVGVDHAYINRIEGQKQGMTRAAVDALVHGLRLSEHERMRLLAAAGHWPWPGVPFDQMLSILEFGATMKHAENGALLAEHGIEGATWQDSR